MTIFGGRSATESASQHGERVAFRAPLDCQQSLWVWCAHSPRSTHCEPLGLFSIQTPPASWLTVVPLFVSLTICRTLSHCRGCPMSVSKDLMAPPVPPKLAPSFGTCWMIPATVGLCKFRTLTMFQRVLYAFYRPNTTVTRLRIFEGPIRPTFFVTK